MTVVRRLDPDRILPVKVMPGLHIPAVGLGTIQAHELELGRSHNPSGNLKKKQRKEPGTMLCETEDEEETQTYSVVTMVIIQQSKGRKANSDMRINPI
jgi:hypothetical protein